MCVHMSKTFLQVTSEIYFFIIRLLLYLNKKKNSIQTSHFLEMFINNCMLNWKKKIKIIFPFI